MLTAATAIESLLQGSPPRACFQTRLLSSKSDLCRPEGCMTSSEIREGRGLSLQSAGLESEEASSANSEVDSSSCLELPDREKNPVKGRDNPKIHYAPRCGRRGTQGRDKVERTHSGQGWAGQQG